MQDFSTFVAAALVVLVQLWAFLKTARHANELGRLFDIDPIQLDYDYDPEFVAAGSVGSATNAANVRFRFRLRQTATAGSPAHDLIERVNLGGEVPKDVDAHLQEASQVSSSMADRYDARASVMVGVPVYLGLMGTFAGIIIGLIQLSEFSEAAIQEFLAGVLVAMFSSFMGVVLMVGAAALLLPRARITRDAKMADFQAALKRQLLARVDAWTATDLRPSFEKTMEDLAGSMRTFTQSIEPQKQMLETLKRLDLPALIKVNADLLAKTQPLLDRLGGFEQSVATMTAAMQGTNTLVTGVSALMDRVKEFESNINALGHKLAVDDTVILNTIEWIKKQIQSLEAGKGAIEQHVNNQDFMVKQFMVEYNQRIKDLAATASQTIVQVGQEISREVQRTAEPEQVAGLLHNVSTLPQILSALNDATRRERASRDELALIISQFTHAADRLAAAVSRLDQDSPWRALVRGTRRLWSGSNGSQAHERPLSITSFPREVVGDQVVGDPRPAQKQPDDVTPTGV